MTILKQKPITIILACDCNVDEKLLTDAILWYSSAPVQKIKRIYMHGMYPAVSIGKQKIHIHRLIAMFAKKELLPSLLVVHHKDGNRLNSSLENLEVVPSADHARHHNAGKTLSDKHKKIISENNHLRLGCKYSERVKIDLVELKKMLTGGASINSCAIHFNCDWSTIKNRILDNPELAAKND